MANNGGGANFLAGVILGAAIGAGVAMLVSPETGEETRRKVVKKSKELIREAKKMAEEIKRNEVDPRMDVVNAKMDRVERDVEERVNNARNAAARKLEVKPMSARRG